MIQVDGNDTVVDDITGLNEAEIYERDPELLFSAYVFEDTIVPATNQPTATNKTASFELNKDKQIESLVADTNLVDLTLTTFLSTVATLTSIGTVTALSTIEFSMSNLGGVESSALVRLLYTCTTVRDLCKCKVGQ